MEILQAFHEFRNHVNMMVNNMDAVALEDSRQAFKTVKYLRQFQTTFFRAFMKTKVLSSFACIRVLVSLYNILVFHDTHLHVNDLSQKTRGHSAPGVN